MRYSIIYPQTLCTSKLNRAYVFKTDDGNSRLDSHGNLVIDHDLDEIAEAFIDSARQQNFSFFQEA